MRSRFLIAYLVGTALFASGAFAQSRDLPPPVPGTKVETGSATIGYSGIFVREERRGGDAYWILQTPSGLTSIPVAAIVSVRSGTPPPLPPPLTVREPSGSCMQSLSLRIHGSNTIGAK